MLALPEPTGKQMEVLYLPPEGHTVVIGSAGSGKTTMSLYRALHLSTSHLTTGGGTAVITYNKSLRNWMAAILDGRSDMPEVLTFHGWARRVLEGADVDMCGYLSNPASLESLTYVAHLRAKRERPNSTTLKRAPQFFSDELRWIDGMGIETLPDYLSAKRTGRGETRLDTDARTDVWAVRSGYRALREERGFTFDLRDIASIVLDRPDIADSSPYQHVVIDEGQDLTPQMLRAIAQTTPDEGSITFFGDPTQQIYGKQMSWKSAGFKVRKQWLFERNHRNTREIAALATAVGSGLSEASIGEPPRRSGEKPLLARYSDQRQETTATAQAASDAVGRRGFVAVLSRTHELADAVAQEARQAGVTTRRLSRDTESYDAGVLYFGTVHAAKGFEFDEVLLIGLDAASWPDPAAINRSDLDAATDQDAKLLYVAVTRARDRLTLSHVGQPTDLLPDDPELYR